VYNGYTVNEGVNIMLEKKSFAMSMFAKAEDLFRAKAEHYEREAEKLQMENVVLAEQLAHLERTVLGQALTLEANAETIERMGRTIDQLERGES
jgi:hypothetical protein